MGDTRRQNQRTAGIRFQQQRLHRADQPPGGGDVDVHDPFEDLRLDMANRGNHAENAGIGDQNIELAPALVDIGAQRIDGFHVGEIEGNQRRRAANGLDGVVKLLKAADRAGAGDDMRAGLGQFQRREIADAARSAGNESDAALEIDSHGLPEMIALPSTKRCRPFASDHIVARTGLNKRQEKAAPEADGRFVVVKNQPLLASMEILLPMASPFWSRRRVG